MTATQITGHANENANLGENNRQRLSETPVVEPLNSLNACAIKIGSPPIRIVRLSRGSSLRGPDNSSTFGSVGASAFWQSPEALTPNA
jgi:hypothetical protein